MAGPRYYALFVVAFFFPPLAVLVARDAVDNYFWLNLVLTLLAWLPGVVHGWWVLLSHNPLADTDWAGYAALTRPKSGGFV